MAPGLTATPVVFMHEFMLTGWRIEANRCRKFQVVQQKWREADFTEDACHALIGR